MSMTILTNEVILKFQYIYGLLWLLITRSGTKMTITSYYFSFNEVTLV